MNIAENKILSLSSPLTLPCGAVLNNRLLKSAMSEQLGDKHHNPVPGLQTLYSTWADGGQAVNVTGNIMVDRGALGEPGNVVLDEDSDLEAFKRWTQAGTRGQTHLWPQLNHPGKQAPGFLYPEPVAPSAIPLEGEVSVNFNPPRALLEEEIWQIIERFATSARLAKECGFTGVQIHGAHGYLVNQFLSPRHNQRQDQWGGSLENRMRFVREVYAAIRRQVGDLFPVAIKLNSADFMDREFGEDDCIQVIKTLADDGIDLVEISGGNYEKMAFLQETASSERTARREAFFIEFAENLRQVCKVPLVVTGGFRSARGMLEALHDDATDMIGLGRSLVIDPAFARKVINNVHHGIHLQRRSTGFRKLDTLTMIDVQWYQQQIIRLSRGLPSKPEMSEWTALLKMCWSLGGRAFQRTRA
ncbi:NADH:flavin oxidoreductase/NADH oxidase family protein [Maricurvus nonylphenolicus]|uniref:NADH:flavin oxidoreductase/NADH oxidase family protein n=1 Tax=Maricurvus nonylphenolicus TaxID=1008307 RepID=UPI0036F3B51F